MIELDKHITRSGNAVWRVYDGEIVIMSDEGTQIHTLNKVASFVWELADGKMTVNDIIEKICDRFEVEKDQAQNDAIGFINELLEKKLVQM